ncbi:MAG: KTSC domain-containing protein [Dehalococcoidia bacterium]
MDDERVQDAAYLIEREAFYDGAHEMDPERAEPAIERLPVEPASSNLRTVGWAAWAHPWRTCHLIAEIPCGILEVEFADGKVARYYHVPQDVAELMQGRRGSRPLASVGAYFHTAIRKHPEVMPYRYVRAQQEAV